MVGFPKSGHNLYKRISYAYGCMPASYTIIIVQNGGGENFDESIASEFWQGKC